MRNTLLIGLVGVMLALGGTASFADSSSNNKASFSHMDENGDGNLSKDEYYGTVGDWGTYSDWDTNDDGLIDNNEWNDIGWDYDYYSWDANNDTYLDSGEFYDGIYGTYDSDHDGYWEQNEWDDADESGLLDF